LVSTGDNTLSRKESICSGDTNANDVFDPSSEWDGFATNTFSGLGSHTANCDLELKLGVLGTVTSCGDIVQIPLTLTADEDVQGFVAVFEWAGAAQGVGYAPSAVIQGADYLSARVEDNYMVIAVVMDFESSVVIPAGADIALGTVEIRCGGTGVATDIIFADGKYAAYEGGPITENVLVVRGQSIGAGNGLTLLNGQFSCESCEGIPTLSELGMSIMSLLLAGTAIWMIRRRKIA
jgi:hypothetical protein